MRRCLRSPFAGAILWWQRQQPLFRSSRRLRRVWAGCILLSLLFAFTSNPNRSLSFLIPDSIDPWIHRNAVEQWSHGVAARSVLRQIPDGAPVAANTPLVPHLADRQVLVRFPRSIEYLDRRGRRQRVEWIAADLAWMRRYAPAFRRERGELEDSRELFEELRGDYGVRTFDDGVVLLQRGAADEPAGRQALEEYLGEPPPSGRR